MKITLLRKAIEEGLGSGLAEDYDPKKHLAELKKSKVRRAR
jgi:hypothetical protein